MIEFTARGRLRHFDEREQVMIALEDGAKVMLRADLVRYLCAQGWGTAPGITIVQPKPRRVKLVAR